MEFIYFQKKSAISFSYTTVTSTERSKEKLKGESFRVVFFLKYSNIKYIKTPRFKKQI